MSDPLRETIARALAVLNPQAQQVQARRKPPEPSRLVNDPRKDTSADFDTRYAGGKLHMRRRDPAADEKARALRAEALRAQAALDAKAASGQDFQAEFDAATAAQAKADAASQPTYQQLENPTTKVFEEHSNVPNAKMRGSGSGATFPQRNAPLIMSDERRKKNVRTIDPFERGSTLPSVTDEPRGPARLTVDPFAPGPARQQLGAGFRDEVADTRKKGPLAPTVGGPISGVGLASATPDPERVKDILSFMRGLPQWGMRRSYL